jgi:hypothetical protein
MFQICWILNLSKLCNLEVEIKKYVTLLHKPCKASYQLCSISMLKYPYIVYRLYGDVEGKDGGSGEASYKYSSN